MIYDETHLILVEMREDSLNLLRLLCQFPPQSLLQLFPNLSYHDWYFGNQV